MADAILFTEGRDLLLASGIPGTVYFGLATDSVDATSPYTAGDNLAAIAEITGTDYARISGTEPSLSSGVATFTQLVWETEENEDWPSTVRSVFMATTVDDSGLAICAWNLQAGGGARDLSGADTIQRFTPSLGPLALAT